MFSDNLLKLSVTLVLLTATAFVSVAAVAAEGSDTIKLVKAAAASPTLGGTADDWYGQSLGPARAGSAAVASDWFERHPSVIKASDAVFASDWFERHPDSIYSSGAVAASDWFERHSGSINLDSSAGALYYGPPGR
jgi:hypothetical protein